MTFAARQKTIQPIARDGVFIVADALVLVKPVDDFAEPLAGKRCQLLFIKGNGVFLRAGKKKSQKRRLNHVELGGGLLEIKIRCRFDPVNFGPELDNVQIALKDFVLAQRLFDLNGDHRFKNLSLDGLLRGKKHVLCQLLGNGGSPTGEAAGFEILFEAFLNLLEIKSMMSEEGGVFSKDHGLLEVGGDLLQRNVVL